MDIFHFEADLNLERNMLIKARIWNWEDWSHKSISTSKSNQQIAATLNNY